MKIKSYHILFRLFSYLSDKTNGISLFVKYKLLLGTLVIGVTNSSASTISNIKPMNDTTPIIPDQSEITRDKPTVNHNIQSDLSQKVTLKGKVLDEYGESLIGVAVMAKDKPLGILTDIDGKFTLEVSKTDIIIFSFLGFDTQEIPVSDIIIINRPIVMRESNTILCYDPVIITYYKDDIYARKSKRITKLPYNEIQTPPVSPVGSLTEFQNWLSKNAKYNESMLKDKIEGAVILSFVVDKQGKITNKKVISKLSPDTDAEALRVLSSSERWRPGEHNGKKIKTILTITVNFKMPE